jgi:hypothetical protein
VWWDFVSVPQADKRAQREAILSLCSYASLCSRFIPLIRDATEWRRMYGWSSLVDDRKERVLRDGDDGKGGGDDEGKKEGTARAAALSQPLRNDDDDDGLPLGTLEIYRERGWCRLELVAALCPKRFRSGAWRPGPINLRYRYHHDPAAPGAGPPLGVDSLLDPRTGRFTVANDRETIRPVITRIAERYAAYEASGSRAWDLTLDIRARPRWLRDAARGMALDDDASANLLADDALPTMPGKH